MPKIYRLVYLQHNEPTRAQPDVELDAQLNMWPHGPQPPAWPDRLVPAVRDIPAELELLYPPIYLQTLLIVNGVLIIDGVLIINGV